jgi:hypothetical protein
MPPSQERRGLCILRVAMLILCFAVFAWGLNYKLSLYKTAHPIHPSTVAKLMQGEQKPWATSLLPDRSPAQSPQLAVVWTIPTCRPLLAFRHPSRLDDFAKRPIPIREMHDLFFRPPPQSL